MILIERGVNPLQETSGCTTYVHEIFLFSPQGRRADITIYVLANKSRNANV